MKTWKFGASGIVLVWFKIEQVKFHADDLANNKVVYVYAVYKSIKMPMPKMQ